MNNTAPPPNSISIQNIPIYPTTSPTPSSTPIPTGHLVQWLSPSQTMVEPRGLPHRTHAFLCVSLGGSTDDASCGGLSRPLVCSRLTTARRETCVRIAQCPWFVFFFFLAGCRSSSRGWPAVFVRRVHVVCEVGRLSVCLLPTQPNT
jgi:hypothetical protein